MSKKAFKFKQFKSTPCWKSKESLLMSFFLMFKNTRMCPLFCVFKLDIRMITLLFPIRLINLFIWTPNPLLSLFSCRISNQILKISFVEFTTQSNWIYLLQNSAYNSIDMTSKQYMLQVFGGLMVFPYKGKFQFWQNFAWHKANNSFHLRIRMKD